MLSRKRAARDVPDREPAKVLAVGRKDTRLTSAQAVDADVLVEQQFLLQLVKSVRRNRRERRVLAHRQGLRVPVDGGGRDQDHARIDRCDADALQQRGGRQDVITQVGQRIAHRLWTARRCGELYVCLRLLALQQRDG